MTRFKERDLIALAESLAGSHETDPSVKIGIGDDCAVLQPESQKDLVVTTDCLAEGIHFDLSYFKPYELGSKSAAVNLSDIAAMGGMPKWALVAISAPPYASKYFLKEFLKGLIDQLAEAGAVLIGGDSVSSSGPFNITVTLVGEVGRDRYLTRSMARPGDLLFCSGYLGEASLGLRWLQKFGRKYRPGLKQTIKRLILRHLVPAPRLELGRALAASGLVRCAIDVSDGPATDVAHICAQSSVKAVIYERAVPISRASKRIAAFLGIDSLDAALRGGEDFELIWTARPEYMQQISKIAAKTCSKAFAIGRIEEGKGVWLEGNSGCLEEISFKGYEHDI